MATIGVYDSGVGGLSVYREIVKLLPGERYIYFADNAYCPYGDKSENLILERAREITDWMLYKGADIMVIACNTATAAAIATLRAEYSEDNDRVRELTRGRLGRIKFIGMEPAIKPAVLGTSAGVVGILATASTLSASKYLNNKSLYEGAARITERVGRGFVELVEKGCLSGPEAEATVRESLAPLLDEGADTVVLGCTHYPFLLETIRKVAASVAPGREISFIDPAPAVARQLVSVMRQEGLLPPDSDKPARVSTDRPDILLKASGDDSALRRTFSLL